MLQSASKMLFDIIDRFLKKLPQEKYTTDDIIFNPQNNDISQMYIKSLVYYYVILVWLFIKIIDAICINKSLEVYELIYFDNLVEALKQMQDKLHIHEFHLEKIRLPVISYNGLENGDYVLTKESRTKLSKVWNIRRNNFKKHFDIYYSYWLKIGQPYELPRDIDAMLAYWKKTLPDNSLILDSTRKVSETELRQMKKKCMLSKKQLKLLEILANLEPHATKDLYKISTKQALKKLKSTLLQKIEMYDFTIKSYVGENFKSYYRLERIVPSFYIKILS